jgi:hypothetical protein
MTTTTTITFSRWQAYGKDRCYVNGLGMRIGRCYVEESAGSIRVRFTPDARAAHNSLIPLWENDVFTAIEAMVGELLDTDYSAFAAAVGGDL